MGTVQTSDGRSSSMSDNGTLRYNSHPVTFYFVCLNIYKLSKVIGKIVILETEFISINSNNPIIPNPVVIPYLYLKLKRLSPSPFPRVPTSVLKVGFENRI
jgi:hypothetical protein